MMTNPFGGHLVVQRLETLDGGLVVVAVQTQHGQALDRCHAQGVLEPSLEEVHSIVEHAVAGEVRLHLFEAHRQFLVPRQIVRHVLREVGAVGGRKALEGVGHPHQAALVSEYEQQGPHVDSRPTAPHPRLEEVAGDTFANHRLHAFPDVVQPDHSDHGLGLSGPVPSGLPQRSLFSQRLVVPSGHVVHEQQTASGTP